MLYERALTESASESNFNLWLQYGWWLDYKLKIRSVSSFFVLSLIIPFRSFIKNFLLW